MVTNLCSIGYAHGFMTWTNSVIYKCSDYCMPETEGSLLWSDPDIGIDWPILDKPILSNKDAISPMLREFGALYSAKTLENIGHRERIHWVCCCSAGD